MNLFGLRNSFLAFTSISIALTTAYTVIVSTAGNRPVAAFDFPDRIPLKSWQQTDSRSLSKTKAKNKEEREKIKSSQSYSYRQDGKNLTVEMRYIVGTRGDVDGYIQKYTKIPQKALQSKTVKEIKDIGFYQLFSYGDRVYLSSCISPRSLSSVTNRQFSQNRYSNDLKLSVALDWLTGKTSIRDRRCLWTHLSMTSDRANLAESYQALEIVWSDWYQWWLLKFPSL